MYFILLVMSRLAHVSHKPAHVSDEPARVYDKLLDTSPAELFLHVSEKPLAGRRRADSESWRVRDNNHGLLFNYQKIHT